MVDQRTPEPTKPVMPVSAARRRLWTAIRDFVQGRGGWVHRNHAAGEMIGAKFPLPAPSEQTQHAEAGGEEWKARRKWDGCGKIESKELAPPDEPSCAGILRLLI